ncbi:uncharacterized protein LOC142645225, partial [Dermatophagoides pteronyssinus]|uniref:uncharacterized protein LOC142645225 n=1 Tax=Dermatophagoides pteronyssinus TaxID=6956 RepID=UPI003F66FC73
IIIWLISGLFAWLLTYSSEIVRKKDASYHLLEVLLRDFYEKNSSTTFDDNFNDTTGDQQQQQQEQEKFFENFLINQQQPNYQINRCRNSINLNLKQFIQKNFHIKPDLLKTIFVFITQYFIPLTLIGFLYIRIGKIIYQQGKLCNVQENAKTRIKQRKKLRRLLMLILMVMAFAICWLPLHLFHLLIDSNLIDYNYHLFMINVY